MANDMTIPSIPDLLLPVLKATHALGGSAARAELLERVRGVVGLTDEQIAVVYSGSSGKSKVLHRAEWTIYWLKRIGALESSKRGISAITPAGTAYLGMDATAAVPHACGCVQGFPQAASSKEGSRETGGQG